MPQVVQDKDAAALKEILDKVLSRGVFQNYPSGVGVATWTSEAIQKLHERYAYGDENNKAIFPRKFWMDLVLVLAKKIAGLEQKLTQPPLKESSEKPAYLSPVNHCQATAY